MRLWHQVIISWVLSFCITQSIHPKWFHNRLTLHYEHPASFTRSRDFYLARDFDPRWQDEGGGLEGGRRGRHRQSWHTAGEAKPNVSKRSGLDSPFEFNCYINKAWLRGHNQCISHTPFMFNHVLLTSAQGENWDRHHDFSGYSRMINSTPHRPWPGQLFWKFHVYLSHSLLTFA